MRKNLECNPIFEVKKNPSFRMSSFLWRRRRDLFAFRRWRNNGFARSSPREQQSTGLLHSDGSNPSYKKEPILSDEFIFMAEKEGFEPSIPFWGIHDFQSCALGQLRDFSIKCFLAVSLDILQYLQHFVKCFFSFLRGVREKIFLFRNRIFIFSLPFAADLCYTVYREQERWELPMPRKSLRMCQRLFRDTLNLNRKREWRRCQITAATI